MLLISKCFFPYYPGPGTHHTISTKASVFKNCNMNYPPWIKANNSYSQKQKQKLSKLSEMLPMALCTEAEIGAAIMPTNHILYCLKEDWDVEKLNRVHANLWLDVSQTNPHSLHFHLTRNRYLQNTIQAELHLAEALS